MRDYKLKISLIPKGAWGNSMANLLPQKDWDIIRNYIFKKYTNTCGICGAKNVDLDAHEEWCFDKEKKIQTLVNIIPLCSKCHGVVHMRNTERIGYGDNAKRHFIKINNASAMDFASHYANAQMIFEELNEVYRWRIVANLAKFGGENIKFNQRYIKMIENSYKFTDWQLDNYKDLFYCEPLDANFYIPTPRVRCIEVDNYQGEISIVADYCYKIEMLHDREVIKTKFNLFGKMYQEFSVENLTKENVYFKLTGVNGSTITKQFKLMEY